MPNGALRRRCYTWIHSSSLRLYKTQSDSLLAIAEGVVCVCWRQSHLNIQEHLCDAHCADRRHPSPTPFATHVLTPLGGVWAGMN